METCIVLHGGECDAAAALALQLLDYLQRRSEAL